jgi:RND family efflux transporter MFP subunit
MSDMESVPDRGNKAKEGSVKEQFFKECMGMLAAGLVLGAGALSMTGCGKTTTAAGSPPPPDVLVAVVEQKDIPIEREWIGTLDGLVNSAIRAEVTGYLLRQDYAEGSFVRKGQLLFEIDPRPFQAALDQALGQLAQANGQLGQAKAGLVQYQAQFLSAEANQKKAQQDEDKYVPLAQRQAITQQDLDNATQTNQASKAQVAAAKAQIETAKAQIEAAQAGVYAAAANVETAKVNLGFTRLTSPIDGIAGVASTQVGNLVSQSSNAITTVSTLDPIKANFTVSEQEYLTLTRDNTALNRLQLELILSDGSLYPQKGRFSFADRQVDLNTGAIQMTGLFPNAGNRLRPGQYAKVRAAVAVRAGALLVPQRSVNDTQGSYSVAVVDSNNIIRFAPVKVGDRVGSNWVIEQGLKPGQRVVTDGLFKIRPGAPVNPKVAK